MARKDVLPSGTSVEEPPPPSAPPSEAAAIQRPLLILVAGLAGLSWIAILAALALSFANPVTLNLAQLRIADAVAHLRVVDSESGTCDVRDVLAGHSLPGSITVENLRHTAAREGEEYFVPLSRRSSGAWVVTPAPLPKSSLLIYPAGDDASGLKRRLEALLQDSERP